MKILFSTSTTDRVSLTNNSEGDKNKICPQTAKATLYHAKARLNKVKPEHIKAYCKVVSACKKSYILGYLNESAAKIINAGANPEEFETFLDMAVSEVNNRRMWTYRHFVYDLSGSFMSLIKSNPSREQWKVFKDLVAYSKQKKIPMIHLPECFASIVNAKPTKEEWETFKEVIEGFKKRKCKLTDVLVEFSLLLKLKPSSNILSLYSQIIDYSVKEKLPIVARRYEWQGKSLTYNFYHFVKSEPSAKLWEIYEDMVSHFKGEKWGLRKLTETFCHLASVKLGKEKLNRLVNLIAFHKGIKKEKGEHPDTQRMMISLLDNYSKLVGVQPGERGWKLYDEVTKYYKKNNWSMENVTHYFAQFLEQKPSSEMWETCKEVVKHLINNNKKLSDLFHAFDDLTNEDVSGPYLDLAKKCFLSLKDIDSTSTLRDIAGCCVYLNNLKASQGLLNNVTAAISDGTVKSNEELVKLLSEITAHAAISNLIRNDAEDSRGISEMAMRQVITNDTLPYPLQTKDGRVNPSARRTYNETLEVYTRAFDFHHGFSSLTIETKRPPTREHSLLARFGRDVAHSIKYLNAKDINLFPGRGFLISGLIPERLFVQDKEAIAKDSDPYHKYKAVWQWGENEFDDLEKTHFIFTRGFIAISCPGNTNYELSDIDGKKVHYSYIVFNDHFHNDGDKVAFLIPTEILKNKIQGTTIPYDSYTGPQNDKKDINEVGLTLEDIVHEAKAIPANVLNLGWGSNIGGSLCNAYEPGSKPYYEWEDLPKFENQTRDIYGHVHKSHMGGSYADEMTRSLSKKLKPLREAHDYIYALTTKYQNLLDLFRLSLSLWHKGQTMGGKLEAGEISDDDLFNRAGLEFEEELITGDAVDFANNQASTRMLVEAYKWHQARASEKTKINDFPVLACAETLDYWNKPGTSLILDTYDMSLKAEDKKLLLPEDSNGTGDEEATIWYSKVIPQIMSSSKDLRFYDRRDLDME